MGFKCPRFPRIDYEPNKKRNVSFSLLSMCVYIHVVSATRYGETFSVERGDDEEMKIVDKWLATSSSYECTHIHTSILTGKKHVEELFHGLRVRARREFCWIDPNGRPTARDSVSGGPLDPAP
jgi:hypothetical protein